MQKKTDIKNMVLGALLATAIVISVAAAPDGAGWEYKVITGAVIGAQGPQHAGALDSQINSHVAQGWQFVSASGVGERSGFAVLRREKE
jgi:hypothetical protein